MRFFTSRRKVWEPNTCEVLGGGVRGAWDRFNGSVHWRCRFETSWKRVKVDLVSPMAVASSSTVSRWMSSTEASLKATVDLLLLHHTQPWLLEIIDWDMCVCVCESLREWDRRRGNFFLFNLIIRRILLVDKLRKKVEN